VASALFTTRTLPQCRQISYRFVAPGSSPNQALLHHQFFSGASWRRAGLSRWSAAGHEGTDTRQRSQVEAKGATSSAQGSNRDGKPYSESQVFDRVAKGFSTVFRMQGECALNTRVVFAVPDTEWFRKYLDP